MFEKFSDYMYYLLTTPLKQGGKKNQFFLFFKVVGKIFDDTKADIMKLRDETLIESASERMLEIHAQERDMIRFKGETVEDFRKRLQMKTITAELSGSKAGILLALKGVGYDNCHIEPVWKTDQERWAEIYIDFLLPNIDTENKIDFQSIKREVMKTKQASTYPNYRFKYPTQFEIKESIDTRIKNQIAIQFFDGILYLNGLWWLEGTHYLNAELVQLPSIFRGRIEIQTREKIESGFTIHNNLWHLNGGFSLQDNKKLNAYTLQEDLS